MVFRDVLFIGMILFPGLLVVSIGLFRILLMTASERRKTEYLSNLFLTSLTDLIQSLLGLIFRKVNTIIGPEPAIPTICFRLIGIIPGQTPVVMRSSFLKSILNIITLVIFLENNNGVNHRASEHILLILKVFLDKV